jgi:tetratricopeptide (TPR) repeat protein
MGNSRQFRIIQVAALSVGVAFAVIGCGATMAQFSTKLQQGYQAQRAYDAGFERYKARDYAGAIPYFTRALELEAAFDEAEAYLAWSYYYTGNYPRATLHFRQALVRQPKWEGLYDGLGWSRYQVGRYNLALESFREALALDPRFRDAAVGYAYALFELGRYAEALPHLERLTRGGEGSAIQTPMRDVEDVRSRLAWTFFYLGGYDKARDQFLKGLKARPDWYGLHNGLGWTYLRLGDRVRARASFQRALELQPSYADAKEGLTRTRP